MTVLQERPEAQAVPARRPAAAAEPVDMWFDTSDHKRIGLLFIYASLLFVVASAVAGVIVAAKQASPSLGLTASRFDRLYGMHTQSGILLFLTAIWIGLATYLVPLQIGAGRLALPRLSAMGFWIYLFGGICFMVSYLIGQVNGLGITQATPIVALAGGATRATTLWIVSLALVSVGFLLALVSLLATIAGLRTEGMTLLRVPAFTWATLVTAAITMVATPVFLGGLLLLGVDQYFGGKLFDPSVAGNLAIWQRSIWLYGRPDVYLLTIMALGAGSDIVATHARRPLINHRAVLVLLGLLGALSLGSWAAGTSVVDAVIVPTFNVVTGLVVIPLGMTLLMWLATAGLGRPKPHVSLLFVAGAIGLWVIGAANAIGAGFHHVAGFHGASSWVAGNVHTVIVGPPTLLAFGALYHWGPKIWGRKLSGGLGSLAFLCLFGGLAASGLAYYFLGYNGLSLGLTTNLTSYQKNLYVIAEVGGVLIALGAVLVIIDLVLAMASSGTSAGDDPYEGLTLEWATTSPPPAWGFDAVPEVRSEAPLHYLRHARDVDGAGASAGTGGAAGAGALGTGSRS